MPLAMCSSTITVPDPAAILAYSIFITSIPIMRFVLSLRMESKTREIKDSTQRKSSKNMD
eukprot:11426721-Ditylum_brightwellii.AAC.1